MKWSRPEQAVVLLALAAALAGTVTLFALRRPAQPVRIIEQRATDTVVVQVDGEVVRPGLYRLPSGSRADDAIRAAGGTTGLADPIGLNLARIVRDGERLTVPSRGASPTASIRRLNINTASAGELEALPGIGPVLAGRIVQYRMQHGSFQRLEDLLQVEGIGPKLLERLRPLIITQ